MKYLTFLDKKCLDELLNSNTTLVGEHYNRTVDNYVFGVVPKVDSVVDQTVLLLTYMAQPTMTTCVRIALDTNLPLYDAIGVNNSDKFYKLAPVERSLAVIPEINCRIIERSFQPDDVVTFHELLELHLCELLKLLGHEDYAKVRIDWVKVKSAWNSMEKTGTLKEDNFTAIKSAVEGV